MTDQTLAGRRVAVLATDGFEQSELEKPIEALKAAGAEAEIVSPKAGQIQGWEHHDKGRTVRVDREFSAASPEDYDSLSRAGASVKNLAHSASFHSLEKIAPSKSGTKHLAVDAEPQLGL